MELFFGDEFLDMISLHLLNAFLQLDLKPLDFLLHLFPRDGANVRIEVNFGEVSLENILHQQDLENLSPPSQRPSG